MGQLYDLPEKIHRYLQAHTIIPSQDHTGGSRYPRDCGNTLPKVIICPFLDADFHRQGLEESNHSRESENLGVLTSINHKQFID